MSNAIRRVRGAAILAAILALASAAGAHEQSMHRGEGTHGVVETVSGEQLTLRTEHGLMTVTVSDSTKLERGEHEVGRSELVAGVRIVVFGTKLPGGSLVAKEIVLAGDAPPANNGAEHSVHP